MKTQLLVSVRSLAECEGVLRTPVGLVDLKEPQRGSLGRPSVETIEAVGARMVVDGRPWSVAMGELCELSEVDAFGLSRTAISPTYVKVGLSGSADSSRWRESWARWMQKLPNGSQPVAVAYADHQLARSVDWREILELGIDLGCRVLLIDTFDKTKGRLRDWITDSELRELRETTAKRSVRLALAGSLNATDLLAWNDLQPDWFAVRSAVCRDDRAGELQIDRLELLLALLAPDRFVSS